MNRERLAAVLSEIWLYGCSPSSIVSAGRLLRNVEGCTYEMWAVIMRNFSVADFACWGHAPSVINRNTDYYVLLFSYTYHFESERFIADCPDIVESL